MEITPSTPEWLRLVIVVKERLGYERLVGDLLGVSFSTVSSWLRGKLKAAPKDVEARVIKPLREYLKKNPVAGKNPCKRERIWASMRILRTFTRQDIVATAEASDGWVAMFLKGLVREGYVKVIHSSRLKAGDFWRYQIIKDTGPKAPFFTASGMVDPNLDRETPR